MSESESDSTSTTASESNRSIPAKPCEGRGNPRTAGSRLQLRHWPCIPTQHPKSASLHWGLARAPERRAILPCHLFQMLVTAGHSESRIFMTRSNFSQQNLCFCGKVD